MFKSLKKYKKLIKESTIQNQKRLEAGTANTKNSVLTQDFYKDMLKMDLKNDYAKLVKNLDKDSIATIDLILGRIRLLNEDNKYKHTAGSMPIFSAEEIAEREKQNKELFHRIVKLGDNCYKWQNFYLPVPHFEESVFFYKHNIDTLNSLEKIKGRDIVDVGGFVGDSAAIFSEYTTKKVYSFEPTNKSYDHMTQTIAMNNLKNVEAVKMGLGSKDETAEINLYGGASSILPNSRSNQSETINITTLDKYSKEHNLDVGLIKVDVEGFEPEFLKGAVETIKEHKPTILLSIYHNAHDFFKLKVFLEELDLGYKFKIFKPINHSVLAETILIAEV